MKTIFQVLIDNKPNTLTRVCHSHGGIQYNTENNHSAHTFNTDLNLLPKNKEIKTNGHTYIILSAK